MQTISLLGSALGLAFVSGVNLYAAVLTVGLSLRFNLIQLPDHLQGLQVLNDPFILIAAAALYAIEFLVDKIPWLDSAWDSVHTFIRPVGAALIGLSATSSVSPSVGVLAVLAYGGIGLSSHTTKAGARLVVNQSPEPVTNGIVSVFEDILVVIGAWIAMTHPIVTFMVVLLFLVALAVFLPKVLRLVRLQLAAVGHLAKSLVRRDVVDGTVLNGRIPKVFHQHLTGGPAGPDAPLVVRCFSSKGVGVGKHLSGCLCVDNGRVQTIFRRRFRTVKSERPLTEVRDIRVTRKLLFDRIRLEFDDHAEEYLCPKGQISAVRAAAEMGPTVPV